MKKDIHTAINERREATRFTKERAAEFAVVLHPTAEEMLAEVHDESLGGIALRVPRAEPFPVGQVVEIIYLNQYQRATVKHVELEADGSCIVGFACERS